MKNLVVKLISDRDQAQALWKELSPMQTPYDSWEFRACFNQFLKQPLHFLVAYEADLPVAMLGLQKNEAVSRIEFFGDDGTDYMEENRAFVRPGYEAAEALLYAALPQEIQLNALSSRTLLPGSVPSKLVKYALDLSVFESFEDLFTRHFKSNMRNVLRRQMANLKEKQAILHHNRPGDLEKLFELNIAALGERSFFLEPHIPDIFRALCAPHKEYNTHIFSYEIESEVQAVSIAVEAGETLIYMQTGAQLNSTPGIGNIVALKNIEFAFQRGLKLFDAGCGAYNWKERFHLTPITLNSFVGGSHACQLSSAS